MEKKPFIFNLYTTVFLLIALSLPLQIIYLYQHNLSEINEIYNKLTFLNILVLLSSLLSAFYAFRASKKINKSFFVSIVIIGFNNLVVANYGIDYTILNVFFSFIFFTIFCLFFIFSKTATVRYSPEEHWWKVSRRVSLKQYIKIKNSSGTLVLGETYNLSKGGAFISLSKRMIEMLEDGKVYSFSIGQKNPFKCHAKIIRISNQKGIYPQGIGIKFEKLKLIECFMLKKILLCSNRL